MSERKPGWRVFVSILGAIGVAISAIVGAFELWDRWRGPVAQLSGSFLLGEFVWPPDLDSKYSSLNIYWSGEIVNEGSVQLAGVRIFLPEARFALLRREGSEPEFLPVSEVVSLGNLQPGESVEVYAWGNTIFVAYRATEVRLTHENGIGSVDILTPTSTAETWPSEKQLRKVYIFSILLLTLIIVVLVGLLLWPQQRTRGTAWRPTRALKRTPDDAA